MQLPETMIAECAARVLESMAFAMVMPVAEEPNAGLKLSSGPELQAVVRFHGPVNGAVTLTLPQATLNELTENMLAVTDGPAVAQARLDALGELANVICGNLLPEIAGTTAVFSLDRSEVRELPVEDAAASPAAGIPPDQAPGQPVRVRLDMATGWVEVAVQEVPNANCPVSSHASEETGPGPVDGSDLPSLLSSQPMGIADR